MATDTINLLALQLTLMDSQTFVWPLKCGWWTPTLWSSPSAWGDALSPFGVAPLARVMESHVLVCPSSWVDALPRFGPTPRFGVPGFCVVSWAFGLPLFGCAPQIGVL